MDQPRSIKRQMVFQEPNRDRFLWACSHCEWNTPYLLTGTSHAVDPVQVVSDFEVHDCLKFPTHAQVETAK